MTIFFKIGSVIMSVMSSLRTTSSYWSLLFSMKLAYRVLHSFSKALASGDFTLAPGTREAWSGQPWAYLSTLNDIYKNVVMVEEYIC